MSKKNKKIKIVAYVNFKNRRTHTGHDILQRVLKRVDSDVVFEYKICSPPEDDENTHLAAKSALAAKNQGQFNAMFEMLIEQDITYSEHGILSMAQNIGLDMDQFQVAMDSTKLDDDLKNNGSEAQNTGADFIPILTINGQVYKGAWDEQALLEAVKKSRGRHIQIAIDKFFTWAASAAFTLLIATIAALVFSNSGLQETFREIQQFNFGFVFDKTAFKLSFGTWVNDGLMTIFFLLIGLEIKREILYGELSDLKRAAMPVVGAIGGMIMPVAIYFLINIDGPGAHGWGIPMATDIALTLGLMALLGSRVPLSLKVFISALAVADDLGAILVIAIFYGHGFHFETFFSAIIVLTLMALFNYLRIYSVTPYIVLGTALWFLIYTSGLHATIAGVLTAAIIPSRRSGDLMGVATQTSIVFENEIAHANNQKYHSGIRSGSLRMLQNAVQRLREPSYYLEHGLEKWVNFLILPLFAFFNTGILLAGTNINIIQPINLGIILGLCVGKPLGIVGACWLADKTGIAKLSAEITWPQICGGGFLAGIGFTMSIVVAGAAFDASTLDVAKISILISSTIAALIGLTILYFSSPKISYS